MKLLNSAAEPPPTIRPCLTNAARTPGSFSAAFTSALMHSTTAAGVPAAAKRTFHASATRTLQAMQVRAAPQVSLTDCAAVPADHLPCVVPNWVFMPAQLDRWAVDR